MRRLSPSEITAARIPKITDLRDQLCYGDAGLARCSAFVDDLRIFRRRYFSSTGLQGTDLWDWKSPEHQDALKQMTTSFLDEHGFGEAYWPSDPTSPNFNPLQYSKDRTFILRTMRQLIFRLNLQQYRNNKYKKKENQPNPKVHDIIDLEDEALPTNIASGAGFRPVNTEVPTSSLVTTASARDHTNMPSTIIFEGLTSSSSSSDSDVYEVPTSPRPQPEPPRTKRKLNAPKKTKPLKRSKIISLKVPSDRGLIPNPEKTVPKAVRTSPRARRTVQRPDYADVYDLNRAIESQEMTAESSLGHDDDVGASRPTSIRQDSEHIEDVLNYIRTNRPSVTSTSVPSTPVIRQANSAHDPRIDPNLENIVPSSSIPHQTKPNYSSSSSTIINMSNRVQHQAQPLPSPAPTMSTIEPAHENIQQTSASPMPMPIPQAASSNQVPASSTRPKSNIDFSYIVIQSRMPVYQHRTWTPKGHFLDKSLDELLVELPFDNKADIEGLTIRLQGPGVTAEETLKCGEDAKYDTTKGRFLRLVKMCLKNYTKANPGKTLAMTFEFEALREGGVEEEDDDDDDLRF